MHFINITGSLCKLLNSSHSGNSKWKISFVPIKPLHLLSTCTCIYQYNCLSFYHLGLFSEIASISTEPRQKNNIRFVKCTYHKKWPACISENFDGVGQLCRRVLVNIYWCSMTFRITPVKSDDVIMISNDDTASSSSLVGWRTIPLSYLHLEIINPPQFFRKYYIFVFWKAFTVAWVILITIGSSLYQKLQAYNVLLGIFPRERFIII